MNDYLHTTNERQS